MEIGLGIITYNRKDCLIQCINSIRQTDAFLLSKIIVADDASTDGTAEWLEQQKDIISVLGRKNVGIARNSNRALSLLRNVDYGFLINDDVKFNKPGWVRKYVNAMIKSPYHHFGFMGGQLGINLVKVETRRGVKISFHNQMMGSFLTFTKKVLERVGGFNAHYGKYGFEHSEWTERISLAGLGYPCDLNNQTPERIKIIDIAESLEYISDIPFESVYSEPQKLEFLQQGLILNSEVIRARKTLYQHFITEENA